MQKISILSITMLLDISKLCDSRFTERLSVCLRTSAERERGGNHPRTFCAEQRTTPCLVLLLPESGECPESITGKQCLLAISERRLEIQWARTPEERPKDFYQPSFDVSGWDNIPVPSSWNIVGLQKDGTQKYGTLFYVNQPVIFQHKVAVDDWRGGVMRTPPENWTTFKDRNEVEFLPS